MRKLPEKTAARKTEKSAKRGRPKMKAEAVPVPADGKSAKRGRPKKKAEAAPAPADGKSVKRGRPKMKGTSGANTDTAASSDVGTVQEKPESQTKTE